MFTSNFARYQRLPEAITPIAIAVGVPGWFKGKQDLRLAPTREMLHLSREDYVKAFDELLSALDPIEIHASLGPDVALLCWESPGVFCHRRRVAEWLEGSVGITIPEYGFNREGFPAYLEMPCKGSPRSKVVMRELELLKTPA